MMTKLEILKDARRLISKEIEIYVCNAIQYGSNDEGERFHRVREGERFNHAEVDLRLEKQVGDLVDRVSYLIRGSSTMTRFVAHHANDDSFRYTNQPTWYSEGALETAKAAYVSTVDDNSEGVWKNLRESLKVLRLELLDYMIKEES